MTTRAGTTTTTLGNNNQRTNVRYTETDQRELYRDTLKHQQTTPFKVERVVNYDNMFSENNVHPSYAYRFATQTNYNPNYFPPKSFVQSGRNEPHVDTTVVGPDRYKFFHRPLIGEPTGAGVSSIVDEKYTFYVSEQKNNNNFVNSSMEEKIKEFDIRKVETKDVGTQSLYRENETQTIPYFPEVKTKPSKTGDENELPEYMTMDDLFFEDGRNGGFIGEDDIKIVDRTRRRRFVESQLPKACAGLEEQEFQKRLKMLKDLEMTEFTEREEEIAKAQQRQLEHLRARLEIKGQMREEKFLQRLENKKKQIETNAVEKLKRIEKKKLKNIRKTVKKYDNPENVYHKRDVLFEYIFPASKTYAPVLRDGNIADLNTLAYEIKPALLTDPVGIEEVQLFQVNKFLNTDYSKASTLGNKETEASKRKEKLVKEHLQIAINKIENKNKEKDLQDKASKVKELYKATPRIVRPETPTLDMYEDESAHSDELEGAATLIQKLLRGRAAQEEFYEGKERSIELIKELQAVEEIKQKERENEQSKLYKEQKRKQNLEQTKDIVMDNIQGKLISNALDFLSKELIRQEEIQKIHQLVEFAEIERQDRERQELKRREKEQLEKEKREKLLNETIDIHEDTVSSYLLDIFDNCVQKLAHKKALEEVLKEKENEVTHTVTPRDRQVIHLVKSFLLPQVQREFLKKEIIQQQNKYIYAAHSVMTETIQNLPKKH
ncbi:hypothetical protein ABK040_008901 [Willaertia magna]